MHYDSERFQIIRWATSKKMECNRNCKRCTCIFKKLHEYKVGEDTIKIHSKTNLAYLKPKDFSKQQTL